MYPGTLTSSTLIYPWPSFLRATYVAIALLRQKHPHDLVAGTSTTIASRAQFDTWNVQQTLYCTHRAIYIALANHPPS